MQLSLTWKFPKPHHPLGQIHEAPSWQIGLTCWDQVEKPKPWHVTFLTTRKLPPKFLIYSIISLFNIIVNVQSLPLLMYVYLFLTMLCPFIEWCCKAFHSLFPILKYCIHLFLVQGPHIWRLLQDRLSFSHIIYLQSKTSFSPMIQYNTFTIIISYFHRKCTICWKHFVPFSHYSIAFEK